jgi:catechol 2,3-dioxygenase-like lactoylglutathione lyase family enzyme
VTVRLDVIGIAVKDMAASLRFYRALGIPVPEDQDAEGHVDVEAGGIRMAWDTVEVLKQVYPDWNDQPVGHRIELAFRCESVADVDATYSRVVALGYRGYRAPWDAFWGQRYAIVEDPDGNLISLFW